MGELQTLVNIGKTLEDALYSIGVKTPEQFIEMGSREAFVRIREKDDTACLAKLSALEGAIRGVR
jgi:DNA transformation protein